MTATEPRVRQGVPVVLLWAVGAAGVGLAALVGTVLTAVLGPLALLGLGVLVGLVLMAWLRPAWSLAFALVLAPLEGLQVPVGAAGALSPTEAAVMVTGLGWVLRALTGTGRQAWPRLADWPVLLLLALVAPGVVYGSDRFLVLKVIVTWSAFALAGLTARALTGRERVLVLLALGVGAALLGLEGIQAYLAGGGAVVTSGGTYGRASAGIPDPNYYAGYLQLATVPALAIAVAARGRLRAVALPSVALAAVGIVLSLSRGATLALVLAAALVLVAWSRSRRLSIGVGVALVVLAAVNAGPLLATPLVQSVGERLASSGDLGGNSDRLTLWRFALGLIVDHPFGVGYGRFSTYTAQAGITVRTQPFEQAHNVYLNLAAELGVAALLVFLWWVAIVLADVRRGLRSGRPSDYATAVGVGAAFVGYLFQALTVTLYQVQIIQATFFVLAGLASGLARPDAQADGSARPGTARTGEDPYGAAAVDAALLPAPDPGAGPQAEAVPEGVRSAAGSNSTSGRSVAAW